MICGRSYHDERGEVQDCADGRECPACLRAERDQLRAAVERLKAAPSIHAISVLVDHARGVLPHRYEGACPDSVEGPDVRDPECPVCRAIDSVSRLRTIGPVVVPELSREDWGEITDMERRCDFNAKTEDIVAKVIEIIARKLRTIGPGEVVVSEKELNVLLILERYARKHGPESIDYAIEALDALRSQKEGGA